MNVLSQKTCSTIFESEAQCGAVLQHLSSESLLSKILPQLECQKKIWKHETASKKKVWEHFNYFHNSGLNLGATVQVGETGETGKSWGGDQTHLMNSTKQNYVKLKLNLE
jgi:hypothetical protein